MRRRLRNSFLLCIPYSPLLIPITLYSTPRIGIERENEFRRESSFLALSQQVPVILEQTGSDIEFSRFIVHIRK